MLLKGVVVIKIVYVRPVMKRSLNFKILSAILLGPVVSDSISISAFTNQQFSMFFCHYIQCTRHELMFSLDL